MMTQDCFRIKKINDAFFVSHEKDRRGQRTLGFLDLARQWRWHCFPECHFQVEKVNKFMPQQLDFDSQEQIKTDNHTNHHTTQ